MRHVKSITPVAALILVAFAGIVAHAGSPQPAAEVRGGPVNASERVVGGVKYHVEIQFFKVPRSGSCWDSVGRDSEGRIYFGHSTQRKTAYLYRLDPATGVMRYLGDLHSNVRFGGPDGTDSGKIHSGFQEWTDGCIYFPSHMGEGGGELRYGGHFWRFDPRREQLIDLGIPDPGNTNFCISEIDRARGVAYMVSTGAGILIRYDFNTEEFTALARTSRDWVRYLPMDPAGNVYILGDNRIERYSPETEGLETVVDHKETDPERQFSGVIGAFTWGKGRERLYFVSYRIGAAFAWKVGAPDVEWLGRFSPEGGDLDLRTIYANPEETRLYSIGSAGRADKALFVLDLATAKGSRLVSLDRMLEKEFEGKVRADRAFAHFSDYGGVTGNDGTMYAGFHASGRDQDLAPGRVSFVGLAAIRVRESAATALEVRSAATEAALVAPRVVPPTLRPTSRVARGGRGSTTRPGGTRAGGSRSGAPEAPSPPPRPRLAPAGPLVSGAGVVETYRVATPGPQAQADKYLPVAYWVKVKAVAGEPASRDTVLYVEDRLTTYIAPLDRHLLRGSRLAYSGEARPARGDRPACVDTSVVGGRMEVVLGAVSVARLSDLVVGKMVAFDGLVEPRQAWMARFEGEEGQNWKLIVTLPSGELVDIGDTWLGHDKAFVSILKSMRANRAVRVHVVGKVLDAAPYKSEKRPGSPRDVRGAVLVGVEHLIIRGEEPGQVKP